MVQTIEAAPRRATGRIPPHNLEAEESLLGAMLLSRDAIVAAVEGHVESYDFYKPAHGHIYDAVLSLYSQGEPADPVTVQTREGSSSKPARARGGSVSTWAMAPLPHDVDAALHRVMLESAVLVADDQVRAGALRRQQHAVRMVRGDLDVDVLVAADEREAVQRVGG